MRKKLVIFNTISMSKLSQKGFSLYISLVILSIILAVVLGLNTIILGQIRIIRGIGYSIIAYYAADTGIERGLFMFRNCRLGDPFGCVEERYAESFNLDGDGSGNLISNCPPRLNENPIDRGDSCYQFERRESGGRTYFRSKGYYKGTMRAIEVGW